MTHRTTDTQVEAFLATVSLRETQAAVIYCCLREKSRTDPQIVRRTGIRLSSVNGARNQLMDLGLVRDSGRRRRNRVSGLRNIVWEVVK